MLLKEVETSEVSVAAHISDLETKLQGREWNTLAQLSRLEQEQRLASKWVSGLEASPIRSNLNVSIQVADLATRLSDMRSRASRLTAALDTLNQSSAVRISEVEAESALLRKSDNARITNSRLRRQVDEAKSAAYAKWINKEQEGVLAVEEALAHQLDRHHMDVVSVSKHISTLEEELTHQQMAPASLQALSNHQSQAVKILSTQGRFRSQGNAELLVPHKLTSGNEFGVLNKSLASREAELAHQKMVDSDLHKTMTRQGKHLSDLIARLHTEETSTRSLHMDLDEQNRVDSHFMAHVARQNSTSAFEWKELIQWKAVSAKLSDQIERERDSIAHLEKELALQKNATHELDNRLTQQTAIHDHFVGSLMAQQRRLSAVEKLLEEQTSNLEKKLSHHARQRQLLDSVARKPELAELLARRTTKAASREASTQAWIASLETELSRHQSTHLSILQAELARLKPTAPRETLADSHWDAMPIVPVAIRRGNAMVVAGKGQR